MFHILIPEFDYNIDFSNLILESSLLEKNVQNTSKNVQTSTQKNIQQNTKSVQSVQTSTQENIHEIVQQNTQKSVQNNVQSNVSKNVQTDIQTSVQNNVQTSVQKLNVYYYNDNDSNDNDSNDNVSNDEWCVVLKNVLSDVLKMQVILQNINIKKKVDGMLIKKMKSVVSSIPLKESIDQKTMIFCVFYRESDIVIMIDPEPSLSECYYTRIKKEDLDTNLYTKIKRIFYSKSKMCRVNYEN